MNATRRGLFGAAALTVIPPAATRHRAAPRRRANRGM